TRVGGDLRSVDERALQVLGLEHFTELLDPPLRNQELQTRTVTQTTETVVTEDARDTGPDLGQLIDRDPRTQRLREHRVGGQATTDEALETDTVLRVDGRHEGDILDLVGDILAGVTGDRGLELTGQVMKFLAVEVALADGVDGGGGVDKLLGGDTRNG